MICCKRACKNSASTCTASNAALVPFPGHAVQQATRGQLRTRNFAKLCSNCHCTGCSFPNMPSLCLGRLNSSFLSGSCRVTATAQLFLASRCCHCMHHTWISGWTVSPYARAMPAMPPKIPKYLWGKEPAARPQHRHPSATSWGLSYMSLRSCATLHRHHEV